MKIATATYPVEELADWAAFEAKARDWVARAEGADLLAFPEYGAMELATLTGARGLGAELRAVSDALPRAWEIWAALAAEFDAHILAPSGPVFEGARPVNRAMFFAPNGRRQAHDKLMPTPWERDPIDLAPGDVPVLMETDLGMIGVQICYDCEFPLASRALVEAGADVILIPSQTEAAHGFHRVRTGARARALEGQIITVQSPTQGVAPWSEVVDANAGAAGIYAPPDIGFPDNGIIAQGEMNMPGWCIADVDLTALARTRAEGGVRTFADWPGQFGGAGLGLPPINKVDLRG